MMKFHNSKAQAFYMDFVIAILIFGVILVIYFTYTSNLSNQDEGLLDELIADGKTISSTLLLGGFPSNWTEDSVVRMGLTNNNNIINETLLLEAINVSYNRSKQLLGTKHDFFVFFEDKDGNIIKIQGYNGIGHPFFGKYIDRQISTMSYYFQEEADMFIATIMREEFDSNIYYKDGSEVGGLVPDGDIDNFLDNLSNFDFVIIEDPHFKRSQPSNQDYSDYSLVEIKSKIEDYVSSGHIIYMSEHIEFDDVEPVLDVDFGGKGENPATIVVEDPYLNFTLGDELHFKQKLSMQNTPTTTNFVVIANYSDGDVAISRWEFGDGWVYFFPDFDIDDGNLLKGRSDISVEVKMAVDILLSGIADSRALNQRNLVKITRLVVYDSEIVKMVVYVWDY